MGGPPQGHPGGGGPNKMLNYDEVFGNASAMNFTVYCGGISDSDENTIRAAFSPYGRIMEIRYFRDKGYAFIRYDNKESACSAIVAVNGTDIGGSSVKCSWGKENPGAMQQQQAQMQGGGGDYMRHDMGPPHPHYENPGSGGGHGSQGGQMYYQQPAGGQYYGPPQHHGQQMYNSQYNSQYMMHQPQQYYGGGYPGGGHHGNGAGGGGPGGGYNNY